MNPFTRILKDIVYGGLEKFGRYYSKYRALVVDNEDPSGQGRLRLVIPGIADNPMDYWAWGVGQFSGLGFGCRVIPPKGSMVWVEFEMGDPNKPIWSHGHFAQVDEIPDELISPNIFWFKTPNGHIVYLNDETGEIGLTNKNGDMITSSDKGISSKTNGKIFLGDKEKGDETAALGNLTSKILGEHNKGLLGIAKNLGQGLKDASGFISKISAAATPAGLLAVAISEGPKVIQSIKKSTDASDAINESLSPLTKEIPKVKSSKVVIEK